MTTHSDFWSRRASGYDARLRQDGTAYDNRIETALSFLGKDDKVLDIGCATGEIGLDLAPRIAHYDGCDPADGMIEIAKKKALERRVPTVSFRSTNAFDQAFEAGTYDAVLIFSVLHLVPDAEALLDRARELLRPKGVLIVETPCLGEQSAVKRLMVQLLTAPIKGLSIRSLGYSEVESLVSAAGFDIAQSREMDREDKMLWISAIKTKSRTRSSKHIVPKQHRRAFPELQSG